MPTRRRAPRTCPSTSSPTPTGPSSSTPKADELYAEGAHAASTADDYVRTTVLLASVLFLVGISGHFRVRAARYGLVILGGVIMVTALVIVILSPAPPA